MSHNNDSTPPGDADQTRLLGSFDRTAAAIGQVDDLTLLVSPPRPMTSRSCRPPR